MSFATSGLDDLLTLFGAQFAADALAGRRDVTSTDLGALRNDVSSALAIARQAGERDALRAAMTTTLQGGDRAARMLRAIVTDDATLLPTKALVGAGSVASPLAEPTPATGPAVTFAPPPPPAPAAAAPVAPHPASPAPTRVVPAPAGPWATSQPPGGVMLPHVAGAGAAPRSTLVWLAVAFDGGVALLFPLLPLFLRPLLAIVSVVATITLLVADRIVLSGAGADRLPGWGWLVLPHAYLFRRARALGHKPTYGTVVVALSILGTVLTQALPAPAPHFDVRAFEQEMEASAFDEAGVTVTVACPDSVEIHDGSTFTCDVTQLGRTLLTIEVVLDGNAGAYHWSFQDELAA